MIRTYLVLHPVAGALEDLVDYYRRLGVIEAAVPYGLALGELVHPIHDKAASLAVGSVWTSAAGYGNWVAAPERAALIEGMTAFLDDQQPPVGWAEAAVIETSIDFAPVFGDQPLRIRHRAGKPDLIRQTRG